MKIEMSFKRAPKYSLQIYQVHIADGFSADCDELVHRCLQVENFDYQEFCKIWKEMKLDLVYHGRSSGAEIAELSEELIHIAKQYMVKDTSYFEESVTGLFLVYSLLNLQPFSGFACLRIVPQDVRAINRIEMVARRERRLDILYILGEVLIKWTQYHADERPRGMESVLRKYLEGFTSIDKLGLRPMGVFYRQNEELDHIRDLGSITRQYTLAKKSIFGEGIKDPSLQYINENLANEMSSSLRKLVSGTIDDSEDDEDLDEDDDFSSEDEKISEERSRIVQAIKYKAMSNTVDQMKHLTCADDRTKTKTSPKNKSDLKKPTGKIRTGSHTKLVTTSPKKRKIEEKGPRKKSKSKGNITTDTVENVELNIEAFKSIRDNNSADDEEENYCDTEPEEEVVEQNVDAVEIEIDSLPQVTRTSDWGHEIEIEIIDHTKEKPSEETETIIDETESHESIDFTTTINSSDEEDIQPLSLQASKRTLRTYEKERKDDSNDSGETHFFKKRERREQIRRELKSRFKKMGMLNVANFNDQKNK